MTWRRPAWVATPTTNLTAVTNKKYMAQQIMGVRSTANTNEIQKFKNKVSKFKHNTLINGALSLHGVCPCSFCQQNQHILLIYLDSMIICRSWRADIECQYFNQQKRTNLPSHELWAIKLTLGSLRSKVEIMYPQVHTERNSSNSTLKHLTKQNQTESINNKCIIWILTCSTVQV